MFGRNKDWENQYDEYYSERPQRKARERVPLWIHLGFLATLAVVMELIVWGIHGRPMAERMLKQLATPVGILWLGLLLQTYFAFVRRAAWPAIVGLIFWLVLTISGNYYVRQWIVWQFESPYQNRLPLNIGDPLIAVVVLGGGTKSNLDGWSHLTRSGDRVMTAVRLFHLGQVEQIITTGQQTIRTSVKDLDPNQETQNILQQCNIPAEAILQLPGINTSQEIAAIKTWLEKQPNAAGKKLGIISSAWHLARVESLVDAADLKSTGIEVVLIPADFLSGHPTPDPSMIIPAAENLETIAKLSHEWLGKLIGR